MISLQKIITKLKSLIDKNTADITALNSGLANKIDLTTLQNALRNIWAPKFLPFGFNSTDRYSMSTLKNGFYWHKDNDGALNFPTEYGFMVKFGYEIDGYDFNALYYTQDNGPIYRISGNGLNISGWVQV